MFDKRDRKQDGPREEIDFLDSSASARLKKSCREVFSDEQMDEFENYTIIEEIGRGNMGIVHKATQIRENKIYALKVLPKNVINNPQAIEQFFREICVHKTLKHPNIIHFYKIGVCQETVFIVMEYVLGNALDTLLKQKGRFSVAQALGLTIPLLEAMQYAHEKGVVHRDLKPANILIDEATRIPKIADFGMAKFSSAQPLKDHCFGTPAYMAPEQVISSKNVDIRADIYALGSILYHLLSGKRPYCEIQDPVLLVRTKVKKPPQEIGKLMPDLPDEIKSLVASSIAIDPKKRYSSPEQFLLDARLAMEKLKESTPYGKILRPSEQLKEEAMQQSTAFLPCASVSAVEVPELFMTASRYEIDPSLETFQREIAAFKQSPIGELLSDEREEEQAEFEETLLTMSMAPEAVLNIPKDLEKSLVSHGRMGLRKKDKSLLDTTLEMLKGENLSSRHRYILSELRYLLLMRGNLLTKQKALIEFIDEGMGLLDFKLDEMSRISQSEAFNKKIRKYFYHLVEGCLKTYDQIFIKDVVACKTGDDLDCYLQNYPLSRNSLVNRYKNLRIVKKVIDVAKSTKKKPGKVEKICDRNFGPHENELRKVFVSFYLKQGKDNAFWTVVGRANSLSVLMSHLMRLREKPGLKGTIDRVISLIEVFLDSGGRTSLDKLKTSINFLPQQLRDKICLLVRKRLGAELQTKVRELLADNAGEKKRYNTLLMLLQNPRYHSYGIKLYGYPAKILAGKVAKLRSNRQAAEQVFQDRPIPNEILAFIIEDKQMEVAARACTLGNCMRELKQLQRQIDSGQSVSLLKSLMRVFHCYGKVNFAQDHTIYAITGYQLSRSIVRFYNDPARNEIDLPQEMNGEIRNIIKTLVDGERERQLRKFAKKS